MDDRLYIVILNWNGEEDTIACLRSIVNETKKCDYTIVLVDNGSEIQNLEKLEYFCINSFTKFLSVDRECVKEQQEFLLGDNNGGLLLVKNNENLGFANGNNVALKVLNSIKQQYVLLLNNDTEVYDDGISKLFSFIKEKNCVAVVPQIRYFDTKDVIWNCGGYISRLGVRRYLYPNANVSKVPQDGYVQIDYGTGCALLIDLFNIKGELSDKYFFGEEDFEFALRMRKEKKDIFCFFESVIYHKVGASRKNLTEDRLGHLAYHYAQRLHNLKNYLTFPAWFLSLFLHILSSLRIILRSNIFTFVSFYSLWKEIIKCSVKEEKITKEVFIRLTKRNY